MQDKKMEELVKIYSSLSIGLEVIKEITPIDNRGQT
jgi:hypothetical protein